MCLKGLKCRVVLSTHLHCSCIGRRILLKRVIAEIDCIASGSKGAHVARGVEDNSVVDRQPV